MWNGKHCVFAIATHLNMWWHSRVRTLPASIPLWVLPWKNFKVMLQECIPNKVGWLVVFYGISIFVGYLMPNSIYIYIYQIFMIWKWITWRWQFLSQNSLVCTQLNGFKFRKLLHISIWVIDEIPPGTTTLGQSEPGNNDYVEVLHISQSSRTGASPSDGV